MAYEGKFWWMSRWSTKLTAALNYINESLHYPATESAKRKDSMMNGLLLILDDGCSLEQKSDAQESLLLSLSNLLPAESDSIDGETWKKFEDCIEVIFDEPSTKLASYGTLRPGESNHKVVADISGKWVDGIIHGEVNMYRGYPVFKWKEAGADVPVQILCSENLPPELPRIDEFEGADYTRILVPVYLPDRVWVCYVYEQASTVIIPCKS